MTSMPFFTKNKRVLLTAKLHNHWIPINSNIQVGDKTRLKNKNKVIIALKISSFAEYSVSLDTLLFG